MTKKEATGDKYNYGYTYTDNTTYSTTYHTCAKCGTSIPPGTLHYCTVNTPFTGQQHCQKCGMSYWGQHFCTYVDPAISALQSQLSQMIMTLGTIVDRLNKIEKILDEEL